MCLVWGFRINGAAAGGKVLWSASSIDHWGAFYCLNYKTDTRFNWLNVKWVFFLHICCCRTFFTLCLRHHHGVTKMFNDSEKFFFHDFLFSLLCFFIPPWYTRCVVWDLKISTSINKFLSLNFFKAMSMIGMKIHVTKKNFFFIPATSSSSSLFSSSKSTLSDKLRAFKVNVSCSFAIQKRAHWSICLNKAG